MPRPKLIVCEKSGDWAAALRATLPDLASSLRETRSLPECGRVLTDHPASIVAIEATEGRLAAVVDWLSRLDRDFPQARAIALASRRLRPWEEALREAGAAWAAFSPHELAPAARLIRRRLAQAPSDDGPLAEQILERLPWRRWNAHASTAPSPIPSPPTFLNES